MPTPFETFAEQKKRKPCDSPEHRHEFSPDRKCPDCHGTGEVLNVSDPLFEALWGKCPCPGGEASLLCDQCLKYGAITHGHSPGGLCTRCEGTGYTLRSRADALSLLPKAILEAGYTFVLHSPGSLGTERENDWLGARYFADIHPLSDPDLGFGDVGDTVEDALCAALSKAMEGGG